MIHSEKPTSVFVIAAITTVTATSLSTFWLPDHVAAAEEETPGGIVATQVRKQGHTCEDPVRAKRDAEQSKPGKTVWLLECKSTSYRVRLVPKMAAKVERIEKE
jgi:hypothetical protein